MSEPKYCQNKNQTKDAISALDIILEYVIDSGWKDYKKFSRKLTDCIIKSQPSTKDELEKMLDNLVHPFFDFNEVTKERFLANFPLAELLESGKQTKELLLKQVIRKPSNRKAISKKIRILILERDGYKCRLCGKTANETKLEVDHKVPVAKGGTDSLDNLWTLCIDCNRGKSDLSLTS